MAENIVPESGAGQEFKNLTESSNYSGPPPTKDEVNMAVLTYVLLIFTQFLGPLILWLLKKDQSAFVNDQGKEVLNWYVTVFVGYLLCIPLFFILIGLPLMVVIVILHLIFTIKGILAVRKGIAYRYPFAIRLLK